MNLYIIGLVVLLVPAVKFMINFYKFKKINRFKNIYNYYIHHPKLERSYILKHKNEILKLFNESNIKDSGVFAPKITKAFSIFENLQLLDEQVISTTLCNFDVAIGAFENKYKESFNPIYWLEVIVNLPQHVLKYLNFDTVSTFAKILNLIYWLIAIVLLITGVINREELALLLLK